MNITRLGQLVSRSERPGRGQLIASLGLLAAGLSSCGSSAPSGGSLDESGEQAESSDFVSKPGNGLQFMVDDSAGGNASEFRIVEMYYGRLVEVFDSRPLDNGAFETRLQFEDFVIGEDIGSDGVNYRIDTNPVTQTTRLTILRPNDLNDNNDEFDRLLVQAERSARPLAAKDVFALPPFPFVARNAAVVLRFSDALDHTTITPTTVQVLAGSPPTDPVEARVFADPNHGILRRAADGSLQFHSTRVIIDPSVSVLESEASGISPNALGFPPGSSPNEANLVVRIPSRTLFSASQFQSLRNASGAGISVDPARNGPIDSSSPTVDVVRALRSGNSSDTNNGFMRDLRPPQIVGEQTAQVTSVVPDNSLGSLEGYNFVVDLRFSNSSCAPTPRVGHVIDLPTGFFEVIENGEAPIAGLVPGLRLRSLQRQAADSSDLLGSGVYLSTYEPLNGDRAECFLSFVPRPVLPPTEGVDPQSQVRMRFSEPMDPISVTALDSFMATSASEDLGPTDVISGRVLPSTDLQTFTFVPQAGFPHEQGVNERYFFALDLGSTGAADLAGNTLSDVPNAVEFSLRNSAPGIDAGNYVLRFSNRDEDGNSLVDAEGEVVQNRPEIRGQFLYNLDDGLIRPRPVSRFTAVADRNTPVTSLMNAFSKGLQTPLSPLGSRLMHVWRYVDFNFALRDETLHNLDVEGVSWAPKNGQVIADAFDRFRVRLAHSNRFPDERLGDSSNLPDYVDSGLKKGQFEQVSNDGNILPDPLNELTEVHPADEGYNIDPSEVFTSQSGTKLMPFPMNQNADPEDHVFYTWRDTAILGRGAPDGVGVDPHILVTAQIIDDGEQGQEYVEGQVPSIGLPLLLEYSCYPGSGVGLNSFDVSLAINSSGQPNFRLFATGGIDASGATITKDPDFTPKASGGFNPSNGGQKTKGFDVVFYHGGLDIVVRVSRAITIWIDGGDLLSFKDWVDPVMEPVAGFQPEGTAVELDFRGAIAAPLNNFEWIDDNMYDAFTYDPYGDPLIDQDPEMGPPTPFWGSFNAAVGRITANFLNDDDTWKSDIDEIDGSQLVQVRITFIGNPRSSDIAVLSGIGIPFARIPEPE